MANLLQATPSPAWTVGSNTYPTRLEATIAAANLAIAAPNTAIVVGSPGFTVTYEGSPVGNPKASFTFTLNGLAASFTDTSTDSTSTIASEAWDFGDGGTSTTIGNQSHTYAYAGTYPVTLVITDALGAQDTYTTNVTVAETGTPVAGFTIGGSGNDVIFTDTSTDSTATITAESWDFGDGNTSTTIGAQSHTYASSGTYTVSLQITDSLSATNTYSAPVTVPLTAYANPDDTSDQPGTYSPP